MTTNTTTTTETTGTETTTEAFAERLFASILGAQEVQAVFLGDRMGWYRALAENGPLTSPELAERTGTAERYAREWLEQQAVCGYVSVATPDADPRRRRFRLPEAQAEVLTDEDSLSYVLPIARFVAATGQHLDALAAAYRTGGGVSWAELGADAREAQAAANRPYFLHQLGDDLAAIPALDARLRRGGRVADVGCGGGWSSIGIARRYPGVTVDGFDVDGPSIEMARANAAEAGLADRVRFHVADAAEIVPEQPYDAVFAFECVHDLADPVGVLEAMRRLAGSDGVVVVMDERSEERFTAPAGEIERLLYGYSLMCCLADGMSTQPSAATGTVMRPSTLADYARRAGFSDTTVLPIENDFFRFYQLVV